MLLGCLPLLQRLMCLEDSLQIVQGGKHGALRMFRVTKPGHCERKGGRMACRHSVK